jgi:hypothetical protein
MQEGENKKPKRFPGMKKQPKMGRPKQPKKKYGPFSFAAKIKPGMSDYQKRTMKNFMEVKEGETLEQWKKRTRLRRVKEIDEVKELALQHPLRILQRSRERNVIASKNKFIIVQPVEREFDFMRYYGIVANYYSIKYGIRKEDLEVGFYFYSNIPFTRDSFENVMVLMTGNKTGKLNRFLKEGMLEEIIKVKKTLNGPNKDIRTYLYRLTRNFVDKLTFIYRTLGKMNTIRMNQPIFTPLSPEEKKIIMDMNDEIMDIQMGRKPQDK